jgi:thioredoxin reductase (NADPH)/alkyl hydroperoxide reductase subunit F
MAASLGLSVVLFERFELCEKISFIGHLANVPGPYETGREFAAGLRQQVLDNAKVRVLEHTDVAAVIARQNHVEISYDGENAPMRFRYCIVSTGVQPPSEREIGWAKFATMGSPIPNLWRVKPETLVGREVTVLGGDRPLGTLLRSLPDADLRLSVIYEPAERYKIEEIANDGRVRALEVSAVHVEQVADGFRSRLFGRSDQPGWPDQDVVSAEMLFCNFGSVPCVPPGSTVTNDAGYAPTRLQPNRLITAGDVRARSYQRISIACGSGAESALAAYYQLRGISDSD